MKKKKKHKKKSKRKHEDDGNKSSDSESTKAKLQKLSDDVADKMELEKSIENEFNILGREDSKYDKIAIKQEPDENDVNSKAKEIGDFSPTLPSVSKINDDNEEPHVPLLLGK